jgi:RNA polymerase sigma-70 factor (ECF subfamily)
MTAEDPGTSDLLRRAAAGDGAAWSELLALHGDMLRRTARVLLDGRLQARVDAEDVVQDALTDAFRSLETYLNDPPLPFTVWLRQKLRDRVHRAHRDHLGAGMRSASREARLSGGPDSGSWLGALDRLAASGTTPSGKAVRAELVDQVRSALADLAPIDREVLMLLYFEGHSQPEAAAILGITPGAVRVRHHRALQRMAKALQTEAPDNRHELR